MLLIVRIPWTDRVQDLPAEMIRIRREELLDGDCQHWVDGHSISIGEFQVYIAEVDLLVSNDIFLGHLREQLANDGITHESIELTQA